jgi:metal-responsive CopG/Arc/MetJ family transcriptional regulator
MMPHERKRTTVDLDHDLVTALDKYVEQRRIHDRRFNQSQVIRQALLEYIHKDKQAPPAEPPMRARDFRKQLSEAVASNIRTYYKEWTKETVLDMQLLLEGESIFADRIEHFRAEKRYLANAFVPWLLKRILFFAREGFDVYLVIDSGTSLYWVFRRLERELKEYLKFGQDIQALLKHLVILTNNTAGAYSYVSASNIEEQLDVIRLPTLADIVRCHVLGGEIVTRYAATLGPETVTSLKTAKASAQPDSRKSKFIGLLVGQWVRISEDQDRHPIALARGYGQNEFKREMILQCDEVFLLSPLGKVFLLPNDEIRHGLGKDKMSGRYYEDVGVSNESGEGEDIDKNSFADDGWEDSDKKRFAESSKGIKLVTTIRTKRKEALANHSARLRGAFVDAKWKEPSEELVTREFASLPHFHYDFNLESSPEQQCGVEFPHVPGIKMTFFRKAFGLEPDYAEFWNGSSKEE